MRKIIAILATALLAVSCSSPLAFYNEAPYRTMQGKIAQVTETTYQTSKGNALNKKSHEKFTYTFNKEGQLLTSNYSTKGIIPEMPNTSSTFTYQKGDLVKRETVTQHKTGKKVTQTYQRIKHSKNEDIFVEFSSNKQHTDTIIVAYDHAKQLVTENRKDKNGKKSKSITSFANYRKQQSEQYVNGKIDLSKTFKYDDKGLIVGDISDRGKSNELNFKMKYTKYDSHNNWTECEIYANGVLHGVTQREIVYK